MMKTSITSYSYGQVIGKGEMDFFTAMEHAKKIGADGFEFSDFKAPEGKTLKEFAAELKAHGDKLGLPVVCYSVGGNMMAEDLAAEVERLKGQIDVAGILGCPVMRHDVAGGIPEWYKGVRSFGSVLPRLAEGTKAVTQYAKSKGVKTCVENHGRFMQDADRIVALVEDVGDVNFGALCDFGNFLFADDISCVAVSKVAPFTFHFHAKDFLFKPGTEENPGAHWAQSRAGNYLRATVIGHGAVPSPQNVRVLKAAGYDGYLTVEFEGMEKTLEAIETGLANLKRYIQAAG